MCPLLPGMLGAVQQPRVTSACCNMLTPLTWVHTLLKGPCERARVAFSLALSPAVWTTTAGVSKVQIKNTLVCEYILPLTT